LHRSYRVCAWSLTAGLALLLAACGGGGGNGASDKSSTTTTNSGNATSKPGSNTTTSGGATGTRKLPGKVCDLLTTAEVDAVTRLGQPLTAVEATDPGEERRCGYLVSGAAPIVVIQLQGEREAVDWPALKSVPGAVTVDVRGAEARFIPTVNGMYVYKNGIAVVILIVVPGPGETAQTATAKLAQAVANRLP
jgi:hypothetical protein